MTIKRATRARFVCAFLSEMREEERRLKERRIINASQTKRVVSDCTVRVSATREERASQSSQGTEQSLIDAIGVRNGSDAILHKRPGSCATRARRKSRVGGACGGNTRESSRSKLCIRAERGVCKTVDTSNQENARNEQRFLVVSTVCALPQSVPTV